MLFPTRALGSPLLRRRALIAFGLAAFPVACGGEAPARPVVYDSAGVEIVESGAPGWDRPWRLADAPVLRIGVVDGPEEYQLNAVVSAFRLSDGRIVVANGNNPPEIRIYDAAGAHQRSLGGSGSGPGEFRLIFFADRARGDTIRAYDPGNARITRIAPDGTLGGVERIEAVDGDPAARFILFPGPAGDGFIGRSNAPRAAATSPGHHPGVSTLVVTDRTGTPLPARREIHDGDFHAGPSGTGLLIFSPRAAVAAADSLIYVGAGQDFTIDVYGLDLELRRRIRRSVEAREVTPQDVAAHVEERLAQVRDPARREVLDRLLRERPARSHMPAYDAELRVDDAGNLWVRAYAGPGEAVPVWSVFDPAGAYLGDVTLPPRTRILAIEADRLLVLALDSLDVQQLQVWPLVK